MVEHESGFNPNDVGDMDLTCPIGPYKGKPVYAQGIWQITRCYHGEVSHEQALDVVWSTQWAMDRLKDKDTCKKEWTTCRWYYNLIR